MGDFSLQDTIGLALGSWAAIEKSKVDARLAQSREQIYAYEQAMKSSAVNAAGNQADSSKWVGLAVLAGLGLAVYLVVR